MNSPVTGVAAAAVAAARACKCVVGGVRRIGIPGWEAILVGI